MRVLVVAASEHGSTTEIGAEVGRMLEARGLEVVVSSPQDAPGLEDFDAFVIGSAIYTGHWMAAAVGFAERLGRERPGRPVWLFSSGPVGDPSRRLVQQMWNDPIELAAVRQATGAIEHKIFAGKLDRKNLRGVQRFALRVFRSLEGDFRDWGIIKSWAESIADGLLAEEAG